MVREKVWLEIVVHSNHIYLPMKMEQTECSETSAYKLQTPGNYPKESIQHREHGEQSVPKRRHINSRRPVITQKKTYNIENTANRVFRNVGI